VQTQTIVVPSNSSYDCVYKTMEEELAGG
jgi:hypothetical protein